MPGCARRAQGDLGPNLTLLAGYREPPNFEVSPTTRGISSSILDAEAGAIWATLRDQPGSGGATLGEPAILITDSKVYR